MNEEIKQLLIIVTRLETKLDQIGNAKEIANEALQSSKSAHLRLDKLELTVNRVLFWGSTTVIGSLIIGGITLLFKAAGGKP